ncbi:MAG: HD domain-containing protein [Deltaproteobacteria bacterium]|nr:HD domain-containing protein [Deltaproteobacteria bacterium]
MELIRLCKSDITIGEPIRWDVFDKNRRLLINKGYIVVSERQLAFLISRGIFRKDIGEDLFLQEDGAESPFRLIHSVERIIGRLFDGIETAKELDAVLIACGMLRRACDIDTDAALATLFIGKETRYSITHPIYTALFCEVMSRALDLPEEDRTPLLAAALTMNIAMISLQDELYAQQAPPRHEQKQWIRTHPERGVAMLRNMGVADRKWLEGVLNHHESIDGTGYPRGLKGDEVPMFPRIISIGDFYCAMISGRKYRSPLSADMAMKEIYLNCNNRVGEKLAHLTIKKMGIYPPGSFVKLVNGEIAIVTRRGEKAHCPIVHSIMRANGKRLSPPAPRDCSLKEFTIAENVHKADIRTEIDIKGLWGFD